MKEGQKVSCSNFFPEPIVPVKLGFWGKVEFSSNQLKLNSFQSTIAVDWWVPNFQLKVAYPFLCGYLVEMR